MQDTVIWCPSLLNLRFTEKASSDLVHPIPYDKMLGDVLDNDVIPSLLKERIQQGKKLTCYVQDGSKAIKPMIF